MELEFIDFAPVFGNEKCLGIATIRLDRDYVFRFRISPGKEGQGWFVSPPSMKDPASPAGKDYYLDGFMFDSRMKDEQVKRFVRQHVTQALAKETQSQQSVFAPQGGYPPPQQTIYAQPAVNQPNYANQRPPVQPDIFQPQHQPQQQEEIPF